MDQPTNQPAPWWSTPLAKIAILAGVTCLAFLPAFTAAYTWDDDITLTNNAPVQLAEGLKFIWGSLATTDYYPLTWTTFWIEWRLWESSPYGYHFTNILLHAACAILVWRVLLRLGIPGAWVAALLFAVHPVTVESVAWISQRKNTLSLFFFLLSILAFLRADDGEKPSSLERGLFWGGLAFLVGFGALAFRAVSPLVSATLWLAAGGAAWRYLKASDGRHRALTCLSVLSVLAFACALLSKSSVIALPGILLTLLWFRHREGVVREFLPGGLLLAAALAGVVLTFSSPGMTPESAFAWLKVIALGALAAGLLLRRFVWRPFFVRLLPFVALSLAAAFLTLWFQGKIFGFDAAAGYRPLGTAIGFFQEHPEFADDSLPLAQRVLLSGHVFGFYLMKAIAPVQLAMVYPKWALEQWGAWQWIVPLLAAAAFAAAWRFREQTGRGLLTGLLYAFFVLLPVLGMVDMSFQAFSWVANHFSYLLLPGFLALVVGYSAAGLEKTASSVPRWVPVGLVAVIAAWFGSITAARSSLYRAPAPLAKTSRLWEDNLLKNPDHPGVWNELGIALSSQNRWDESADAFRKSLDLDDGFSKAWNNLGTVLITMGQPEEALEAFEAAIARNPFEFDAYSNAGALLLNLGRLDEAVALFDRTIALRPMSPTAIHNKGIALARLGRVEEGIAALQRAAEMNPANATFAGELGYLLYELKQPRPALAHLLRALELGAVDPRYHNAAAWIMATNVDATLRDGTRALAIAERGLAHAGGINLGLGITRAAALAELGRFEEAAAAIEQALPGARESGDEAVLELLERELELYRSGQPYREG